MTETLRFGLIGKQDLKLGTGTFEVRLGDGRVVTLEEIELADFPSSLTTGSIVFVKAGGVLGEDNSNLFWDDTNNRLGVGTASPSQQLHVVGIILSDANLTFKSGTNFTGTLDHAITADRTWVLPDIGVSLPGVIDRDVTTADVVSTDLNTSVYSFSVPGGLLSTNRALRVNLLGDYLCNAGGTPNLTVRVTYGATTIATHVAVDFPNSANRRMLQLITLMSAANATNAQVCTSMLHIGGANTVGADGGTPFAVGTSYHNAISEDSTAAKTLDVSFQNEISGALISARALAVQLELL